MYKCKRCVYRKNRKRKKYVVTISETPDISSDTFEQNVVRLEFEKNIKEFFEMFGIIEQEKIEDFKNIPCKIVFDGDKLIAVGNYKNFLTMEKIIELSKK